MTLKTLIYDIETAPLLGYSWKIWEADLIQVKRDFYIMSFAAKWLGSNKIISYSLPDFDTFKKDKECDKELCTKLWELMDQADVIVAHNGQNFDIKKSNARFIVNNLPPPSPYKVVDTLIAAKKYFGFNSNKLNDLGKSLGVGQKIETGGFKLWLDCMAGDGKAWKQMVKYNKNDVALLEQVYLRLRPWIANHPRVGETTACNSCGSVKIQKRGYNYTRKYKYQRYACLDCGAWNQGDIIKANNEQNKKQPKTLPST